MAFAGTQTNVLMNATPGVKNGRVSITGLTLAARVGAPDPTGVAADSGLLGTVAAANTNVIPDDFGPGPGNWDATLMANIGIEIDDPDGTAAATASDAHVFSRTLASGNVSICIHNRGAGALPACRINLSIGPG